MFPDNIERLVVDGVVDSYDWYQDESETESAEAAENY